MAYCHTNKKQTQVTGISLNCTFILKRLNPNPKISSTLKEDFPSGARVSVLVNKQQSAVERLF